MSDGATESPQKIREGAGQRIRELREARGMTQEQLAEKIGTDGGTVSRIERGQAGLDLARAVQVAQALGAGLGDLLSAEAKPQPREGERLEPEIERLNSLIERLYEELRRIHGEKDGFQRIAEALAQANEDLAREIGKERTEAQSPRRAAPSSPPERRKKGAQE